MSAQYVTPANNFKFSGKPFLIVAIGATFAFLPSIIGFLWIIMKGSYIFDSKGDIAFYLQIIGSLTMLVGFITGYKQILRVNVRCRFGLHLVIIGTVIGLLMNILFIPTAFMVYDLVGYVFINALCIFPSLLLGIAYLSLSQYFTKSVFPGIALIVLSLCIFLTCLAGVYEYWKGSDYPIINIMHNRGGMSLFLAMALTVVLGSFWYTSFAKPKHKKELDAIEKSDNSSINPGLINQLMAYDGDRLRKIMESQNLYTSAVVAKARELLARREAWEQIKDMTDEELMEMTMAQKGLYNDNIVEAASMELYQRDSQLLAAQFAALSPDTVAAIAAGTAPAPEGIRLAAQKYLTKK